MPKQIIQYDVFVCSPGDVVDERSAVVEVVTELNRVICREKGISLNVIMWETDTFPSFGVDAQDVINTQIGENYDLFIGIMWKRFGTATSRAGSGTEEEFQRALQRFRADQSQLQIMFYFKEQAFVPTKDDLAQYAKVLGFRDQLGKDGGYHWRYSNIEDFKSFLRVHLAGQIARMGRDKSALGDVRAVNARTQSNVIEGEGLLELIEIGNSEMALSADAIHEISRALSSMTAEINEQSSRAKMLENADPLYVQTMSKKIFDDAAKSITKTSDIFNVQLPLMREHFNRRLNAISKSISIMPDFGAAGKAEVTKLVPALVNFRVIVVNSRDSVSALVPSAQAIPRLTSALVAAKRNLTAAVNSYEAEMNSIERMTIELEAEASKVIDDGASKSGEGN